MPEMKNNFQGGKMNKDLDERIVPNNEYRDALNVEIVTSSDSDVGTMQTLKGNTILSELDPSGTQNFKCIGSISDDKNDKLYFFVTNQVPAGATYGIDIIAEYNYKNGVIAPVCVDTRGDALKFDPNFLITGINIIDDLLFWTDNNSEPKRISITRGKWGSSDFLTHTDLMVRDISPGALPNAYVPAIGIIGGVPGMKKTIHEKHLTVIRKGPPAAPVLEMIDTTIGDIDGDGEQGGDELIRRLTGSLGSFLDSEGKMITGNITISTEPDPDGDSNPVEIGPDFQVNDYVKVFKDVDRSIAVRGQIKTISGPNTYIIQVLSGNIDIEFVPVGELMVELEQTDAIFQFKFPRFACRYKYEDGEYSAFSPFTEPAFLPGKFTYLPKEGYNLGMVNRLRKLVIKDFVHERVIDDEVVAIDILYKDSNSTNIYSVKTIKRRSYNPGKWDEWNAISDITVSNSSLDTSNVFGTDGWRNRTKGYLLITTEMIRAVLPANQLLRPWDNVPRKALAQELIGNRLVYGNYLQNYNLKNLNTNNSNIKIDIAVTPSTNTVGIISPEEIHAGNLLPTKYSTAKSIKSLRTYQLGVVYIDKYGRETPVFSEAGGKSSETSVYMPGSLTDQANQLSVQLKNDPPSWATHYKYFIKETSNEYYNLAMDRWYNAEDGNVWLSFPSAERNKVDAETFLILKKEHDNNVPVIEPARYKIIAIENEAPRFIKIKDISMGAVVDEDLTAAEIAAGEKHAFGHYNANGFPLVDGFKINVDATIFENAGWIESLVNQDISQIFFRVKSLGGVSKYYRLKQISYDQTLDAYVMLSGKQFGPDMSHTSPDDSWLNRVKTCELQVIKRIPEDSPEFEGRFFVKILKDNTLIKRLHMVKPIEDGLICVDSMKVQYIAPGEAKGENPNYAPFDWDGYGTGGGSLPGYSISIDEKQSSLFAIPANPSAVSYNGSKFWKNAGNNSINPSGSSGWFIDKVEAFRAFNGSRTYKKRDNSSSSVRRSPKQTFSGTWCMYPPFGDNQCEGTIATNGWGDPAYGYYPYHQNSANYSKMTHAEPINTYGTINYSGSTQKPNTLGYLGIQMKQQLPIASTSASGGKIAPSMGIQDHTTGRNFIHLSYAGLNGDGGSIERHGANATFKDGSKHDEDIKFIEKLLTPGTIWRWKEDPGQVVYITRSNDSISTSGSYSATNRSNDEEDLDNNQGVYLRNYACFSDYIISKHNAIRRRYYWLPKSAGECWGPTVSWKEDWVSRDIPKFREKESGGFPILVSGFACVYAAEVIWPPNDGANTSMYNMHPLVKGAGNWIGGLPTGGGGSVPLGNWLPHYHFPTGIYHDNKQQNRRRRYTIHAEALLPLNDPNPLGLGETGPHYYLPTNDPSLDPHFNYDKTPMINAAGNPIYPPGHASAGTVITTPAPGIRPDGMFSGHPDPNSYLFDPDGSGVTTVTDIPRLKSWDANNVNDTTAAPRVSNAPGSVTWCILEPFTADPENFSSTNPAIWETEPKEDVGLDIYHEVGQIYPIHLNDETIEQFVGAVHLETNKNSYVQCLNFGGSEVALSDGSSTDVRVVAVHSNFVMLGCASSDPIDPVVLDSNNPLHATPSASDTLVFWRANGGTTEALVGTNTYQVSFPGGLQGTWYELLSTSVTGIGVHGNKVKLPWFNCYSFGNGVESDRIRDDFNQVTIDNGPKASTTIEEPYLEERRKNGFIWSGLYNSTSGVNNLNQFIQAEKITKDANPTYGSIQKLHARDSDLVAFCEDRVLKVLANKDALFNADGNTNLVATNRVLGSIKPFIGDFGISLNPESFASDSYRSYFSDTSRGAILRLSRDGITDISSAGMSDWFADNLSMRGDSEIIGSFDNNKNEYNITLQKSYHYDEVGILGIRSKPGNPYNPQPTLIVSTETAQSLGIGNTLIGVGIPEGAVILNKAKVSNSTWEIWIDKTSSQTDINKLGNAVGYTVTFGQHDAFIGDKAQWITKVKSGRLQSEAFTISYSEQSKGWVSFKSWYHENGISLNNSYYTFWRGDIYEHHINETRNNFYGSQKDSSVDILFNKVPGTIKSFSTLNYEGSQARIIPRNNPDGIELNPDYYDNFVKQGWYVKEMISNAQELGEMEFWDKEDKWFAQIKGVKTKWLNDGTAGNIDPREFSYQGIGNAKEVLCPDCPPMISYNCVNSSAGCVCTQVSGSGGTYATLSECENSNSCCGQPPESWCCGSCDKTTVEIEGVHCGCGGNYYEPTLFLNAPLNTPVSIGDVVTGDYILAGTTVVGIYDTMVRRIKLSQKPVVPQLWKVTGGTTDYPLFTDIVARSAILTACYDPGDGSGNYSDKCDCVNTSMCCGNGLDYFFTCKNILPPAGTLVYGCMDDGITTDPWMVRNRPIGWTGPATNYNPSAHIDNCTCEYISAPPPSWSCVMTSMGGSCFDPGDGSGLYTSLVDCQNNCQPTPTWNCGPTPSSSYTQVGCFDPGNGIGTYTSLADCQNNCNQQSVSYDCYNGVCLDPGTGNGQYATFFQCHNSCVAQSWDCNFGWCSDPGDGTGQYNSLAACQTVCDPLQTYDCNLVGTPGNVTPTCMPAMSGGGQYTSLADCNNNCVSIPVTYDCINGACIDQGTGFGQYHSMTACLNDGCSPAGDPLDWEMKTQGEWTDKNVSLFTSYRRYNSYHKLRFMIEPGSCKGHNNPRATYSIKVNDWWTSKSQTQNEHAGFDARRELGIAISSVDYTSNAYPNSFGTTLDIALDMASDLNGNSSSAWFVNNIQGTHIGETVPGGNGIKAQPHFPSNQNPSDDNFNNRNFIGSWSAYNEGGNTYLEFKITCIGDERFKYGANNNNNLLWEGKDMSINIGGNDDHVSFPSNLDDGDSFTDSTWYKTSFQYGQNHDDGTAPGVRGKASSAFPGGLSNWGGMWTPGLSYVQTSFPDGDNWGIQPAVVNSSWPFNTSPGGAWVDSPNVTIDASGNIASGKIFLNPALQIGDVSYLQNVRDRALAGNTEAVIATIQIDCTTWDCDGGNCVDPLDGTGQYLSYSACQQNCTSQ